MVWKILVLILCYNSVFAQENIEKLRNEISGINISFLHSKLPDENKFTELENLLNSFYADEEPKFETSEIITEFEIFLDSLKQVEYVDSLKKTFRAVNNRFNALSYKYFYNKVIKSRSNKIIIFSTSMSCECTLEQCYQQESEIQKFCRDNNYEYVVIDAWEDFELQKKHNVGFIPTVILLNSTNKEIKRFTRVENLYPLLTSLVN